MARRSGPTYAQSPSGRLAVEFGDLPEARGSARTRNGLVLRGTGRPPRGDARATLVVVAAVRGDSTIFDAVQEDGASRIELCHGYPSPSTDAASPRIALFSPITGVLFYS